MLDDEHKQLITEFKFTSNVQEVVDYIQQYFSVNEKFSRQEIIENADITISTALIDILDSYFDELEDINIDLVLNNILKSNINEKIDKIQLALSKNKDPALVRELQELIIFRNAISQKVEKKTHNKQQ